MTDRPHVVIPDLFDGIAGRRGVKLALYVEKGGKPAAGMTIAIDGTETKIRSVTRVPDMYGWWEIDL